MEMISDDYYKNHYPFTQVDEFGSFNLKARHLVTLPNSDPAVDMEGVTAESEARIAAHLANIDGSTPEGLLLSVEDQVKMSEIIYLHDTALERALRRDGHSKSGEGFFSLSFGGYFDRRGWDDTAPSEPVEVGVNLYAYVLGTGRNHYFSSIDRALETVRYWYACEMSIPEYNEEGDFDA